MENPNSLTASNINLKLTGAPGGRPPDDVIVLEGTLNLERPASPLQDDAQRVVDKGRNKDNSNGEERNQIQNFALGSEICMEVDDGEGLCGDSQTEGLEYRAAPIGPTAEGNITRSFLDITASKTSFRDKLVGEKEMCGHEGKLEVNEKEASGNSRNPEDLYGPWMQVVNRRKKPTMTKNGINGTEFALSTARRPGSRFESLSSPLIAEEVTKPVVTSLAQEGFHTEKMVASLTVPKSSHIPYAESSRDSEVRASEHARLGETNLREGSVHKDKTSNEVRD
ncbi:hypothetical protein V6N13_064815 [Hibiscus sabdariffa]